jgi:beta-lactamase regulating signal transducer with metallopeptidase domain
MFWWLGQHLAVTAVLALLVLALCRVLRLSPALRHALWLVVLVKLLAPPLIVWPWAVSDWTLPEASEPSSSVPEEVAPAVPYPPVSEMKPAPDVPVKPGPLAQPAPDAPAKVFAAKRPEPLPTKMAPPKVPAPPLMEASSLIEAPEAPAAPTEPSPWPWEWLALGLWLASAAAMAGVQALRIVRFQRLVRRAEPAPRPLFRLVRELARRLEIRPPRVLVVSGLASPVVWSLGRAQLLWPASLVDRFDAEQRRGIIAHELAHLRRRDHWVGALLLVAECVWWWCPLFWLVRRELRKAAEWACDAWVVAVLPEHRRVYAETLIEVSQLVSQARLPAPVLGIGGARYSFQRRLTMIMCERLPCRVSLWTLPAVGLLALAALPGWSQAQTLIIQDATESALQTERLKKALTDLEAIKDRLEKELAQVKAELADLKAKGKVDPKTEATLRDRARYLGTTRSRLTEHTAPGLWRTETRVAVPRPWGPEQATGAPDCGDMAGDNQKAWASKTEDEQDEWLSLAYEPAVRPMVLLVYENCNPGALYRVTAYTEDGLEHEVWKGQDPTPAGSGRGVSLLPVKLNHSVTHLKLYLRSKQVKGWNEIDAVGVLDVEGKIHWAVRAEASSSYADRETGPSAIDYIISIGTDRWVPVGGESQRLDKLEAEVKSMKESLKRIEEMLKQRGASDPEHRLQLEENEALRQGLKELEQRIRN